MGSIDPLAETVATQRSTSLFPDAAAPIRRHDHSRSPPKTAGMVTRQDVQPVVCREHRGPAPSRRYGLIGRRRVCRGVHVQASSEDLKAVEQPDTEATL